MRGLGAGRELILAGQRSRVFDGISGARSQPLSGPGGYRHAESLRQQGSDFSGRKSTLLAFGGEDRVEVVDGGRYSGRTACAASWFGRELPRQCPIVTPPVVKPVCGRLHVVGDRKSPVAAGIPCVDGVLDVVLRHCGRHSAYGGELGERDEPLRVVDGWRRRTWLRP